MLIGDRVYGGIFISIFSYSRGILGFLFYRYYFRDLLERNFDFRVLGKGSYFLK